jgi:outer membrane protein OmpA-like peptidoglycan-associated protein
MRRGSVTILAALVVALEIACSTKAKHVSSQPPSETARTVVVLLPDSDTGTTGRAFLSNSSGTVELTAARESSTASPSRAPVPVTMMSEEEIQRVFGDALAALPPAPIHFTLYFRFESDELTDESRALLPQILDTVKTRPLPEVLVVGHTDTMGTPRANIELGLTRANSVRNILVQVGLDPSMIEVRSHGEGDLLVKTPDETPEPRNRRVEISVR